MDTQQIISELESERDRLEQAIFCSSRFHGRPSWRFPQRVMAGGGRRRLSAASKKRISEMMKKRWAERKKKSLLLKQPEREEAGREKV